MIKRKGFIYHKTQSTNIYKSYLFNIYVYKEYLALNN